MMNLSRLLRGAFFRPAREGEAKDRALDHVMKRSKEANEQLQTELAAFRRTTNAVHQVSTEARYNEKLIDMIGQLSTTLDEE